MSETSGAETGTRTILFTDLVGSTALRSSMGDVAADEVRRLHDRLLSDSIRRHRGVLVKSLGDGVMAVFEAAADAAACAVSMQQEIEKFRRTRSIGLSIRVGLSAGDVAMEDGDWFGTPVVEAARLEAAAEGDQILASELVRLLAGTRTEVRFGATEPLMLKGLTAPLSACSVLWERLPSEGPLPLPLSMRVTGPLMVGRQAEQVVLVAAYGIADEGARRCVLLSGEAGIGKTRLAAEFATTTRAAGAVVLAGRCDEDMAVPYQPFVEALRFFVRHATDDLTSRAFGQHPGELTRLVPELVDRLPDLAEPLHADPETERYRLFEAMASWLAASSQDDPVLLVLEDLHWAAKPTTLLLRHLLRSDHHARLMVLGTYRSSDLDDHHPLTELLADLRRSPDVERLDLPGLDDAAVSALLADGLGRDLSVAEAEFARTIRTETAGNAFFVGEIVRRIVETGVCDAVAVPDSVRDVVAQRLRRVSEATNEILSTGAVIGAEFDVSVLIAATNRDESVVLDALDDARVAQLLEETTLARYRFAHALVRTTLREAMSDARRFRLHRKIATAIQSVYGEDAAEQVVALAHHLGVVATTDPSMAPAAIRYAQRAGERAMAQLAPDEAVAHFEEALRLLALSDPDSRIRCDLLVALGAAERALGRESHRDTLFEAARLAQSLSDGERLACAVLGVHPWAGQDDRELLGWLEVAVEALPEGDSPVRAELLANLALAAFDRLQEERVLLSREAITMARRTGDELTMSRVLIATHNVIWHPSTLEERLVNIASVVELTRDLRDPGLSFYAADLSYFCALENGDIADASRWLERAGDISDEVGQPLLRWYARYAQAGWHLLQGRVDTAERLANEALELGQLASRADALSVFALALFDIRMHQGRIGEVESILAALPTDDSRRFTILSLRAQLYAELGRQDDAARDFELLAAQEFAAIPTDLLWFVNLAGASTVAARLGDRGRAATLYDQLLPYENHVVGAGVVWRGSAAYFLGLLALTLDRLPQAVRHLERATDVNERIGAIPWLARTHLAHAEALMRGDTPSRVRQARDMLSESATLASRTNLVSVLTRAAELQRDLA